MRSDSKRGQVSGERLSSDWQAFAPESRRLGVGVIAGPGELSKLQTQSIKYYPHNPGNIVQ